MENYIDIHIGVGQKLDDQWFDLKKAELVQYNLGLSNHVLVDIPYNLRNEITFNFQLFKFKQYFKTHNYSGFYIAGIFGADVLY